MAGAADASMLEIGNWSEVGSSDDDVDVPRACAVSSEDIVSEVDVESEVDRELEGDNELEGELLSEMPRSCSKSLIISSKGLPSPRTPGILPPRREENISENRAAFRRLRKPYWPTLAEPEAD